MKKMHASMLQKLMIMSLVLLLNINAEAQGRIELNSASKGVQLTESTMKGFNTTFSYSCIETELIETEYGAFSKLIVPETMNSGEVGAPSLPVSRKLIAVPFGAKPVVRLVNYTTSDYKLSDYGIERVSPEQPSYSKSTKKEDMVFQYNEKAYQSRAYSESPEVVVKVLGTMRGVQLGSLQVSPVSYNPTNNTIRVYNDIEFEVIFEDADAVLTEETLVDSYSPYFNVVYKQLFNARALNDVFEEHPDLYAAPVHMSVIVNSMFEDAIQPWLEWKTEKGFYVDVKYVESSTSSSQIISYIRQQYKDVKPSFVIIVGDDNKVVPSLPYGEETKRVTDLYYASVDGDYFPDMYCSRMSCETVGELENLIEKVLQYEQYTMPDPSYLDNALMIAGVDSYWNKEVGTPSINYATNFYFNSAHGLDHVYKYTSSYNGCYDNINTGVGFVNYTAHGVEFGWSDPSFTTSDVSSLTNKDKYFWALGNCCLTGDWGYDSGSCLGESMIRAKEKGAWGYVGSCPVTYWNEDYYFVVGATNVFGMVPAISKTEMGFYDAFWMDDVYNTLSSVPFIGNLSVTNARENSYQQTKGITTHYYWEAYHTLGDGSVMPYRTKPTENTVSHLNKLPMGLNFFDVEAEPASYVGISKDGVLLGAAMVDQSGTVTVPITPVVTGGAVKIVVTHPRRIPYVASIEATPTEGPYISVTSSTPEDYPVNQENKMTLSVKNVGYDSTEKEAVVTLSSQSEYITFIDNQGTLLPLSSEETFDMVDEFSFVIDENVADETIIVINAKIEYDSEVWENKFAIRTIAPVVSFDEFVWDGYFEPGGTYQLKANFRNDGHYKATNVVVSTSATSEHVTLKNSSYEIGTIEAGEIGSAIFEFVIDEECPVTERIPFDFVLTADNGITAEGSDIVMNSCKVVFTLSDSYGDGWGESYIKVEFDDGTPDKSITFSDGKEYVEELVIATGTKVTISFMKGMLSYECSYKVEYENGELIYDSKGQQPSAGINKVFVTDCNATVSGDYPVVENLVANVESSDVILSWDAPRALTGYKVFRNEIQIGTTEVTKYTDSNVEMGTYNYSVVAVYEDGESEAVSIRVVIGNAIDESEAVGFKVYPNPAKDVICIESHIRNFEYQLINSLGQVVIKGTSQDGNTISVEGINKGIYFLKFVSDGEIYINRIIVQ